MTKRFLCFLMSAPLFGSAQFAPAAGQAGTTAIKKDSSIIINWATACTVQRGLQDVSNPGLGYTSAGDSSKATGPADVGGVVSLGDGGSAVLTFASPIKDLSGPDFCVFENSFDPGFLELAFVEVSSDGINFKRFPAICNVQNTVQIGPFDTSSDPTKINNLAGKYIGGYGVPFDLQELAGTPGLNINAVTHVKIVDVVGCVQNQYASHDSNDNIINDPWATGFASGGFDLDAVGVIHEVPLSVTENRDLEARILVFPNVTSGDVNIMLSDAMNLKAEVRDVSGKEVLESRVLSGNGTVSLDNADPGIYFLSLRTDKASVTRKIVKVN